MRRPSVPIPSTSQGNDATALALMDVQMSASNNISIIHTDHRWKSRADDNNATGTTTCSKVSIGGRKQFPAQKDTNSQGLCPGDPRGRGHGHTLLAPEVTQRIIERMTNTDSPSTTRGTHSQTLDNPCPH